MKLSYQSIDGYRESRSFKTVAGARAYVERWLGPGYEVSRHFGYAVSPDGIGKIVVRDWATMNAVFPQEVQTA